MAQLTGRIIQNAITGICTWEGEWWIIGQEAAKSTFHYASKKPVENLLTSDELIDGVYSGSGYYDGQFLMKRFKEDAVTELPSEIHKEVKVKLTFTSGEELPEPTDRAVTGVGKNKFGTFQINGWFRPSTGQIEIVKSYLQGTAPIAPTTTRGTS